MGLRHTIRLRGHPAILRTNRGPSHDRNLSAGKSRRSLRTNDEWPCTVPRRPDNVKSANAETKRTYLSQRGAALRTAGSGYQSPIALQCAKMVLVGSQPDVAVRTDHQECCSLDAEQISRSRLQPPNLSRQVR